MSEILKRNFYKICKKQANKKYFYKLCCNYINFLKTILPFTEFN